jgi:hypothetical protein
VRPTEGELGAGSPMPLAQNKIIAQTTVM